MTESIQHRSSKRSRAFLGDDVCSNDDIDDPGALVSVPNPQIRHMKVDVLYHLALDTETHDLKAMFSDVKFVCVGGSPTRMKKFAESLLNDLNCRLPAGQTLSDIASGSDRYVMYKAGPVLSVSHGMGISSFSILFHELLKLLQHACCRDVKIFRLGTCGGLGIPPGTVVISSEVVDGLLQPTMELDVLGKRLHLPLSLDNVLAQEVMECAHSDENFQVIKAKTMCSNDFYEGQARLDGAFCDYNEEDKMAFLNMLYADGVRNLEMESLCFSAMCHRANVRGAVLCVTLLDRLKGDQISTSHEILEQWSERPQTLVTRYIKKKLQIQ